MEKSTYKLSIVTVIFVIATVFVVYTNQKGNTFGGSESDFSFSDTSIVNKIVINDNFEISKNETMERDLQEKVSSKRDPTSFDKNLYKTLSFLHGVQVEEHSVEQNNPRFRKSNHPTSNIFFF